MLRPSMRQRAREREREKCLNPNAFANYLSLACSSHISPTVTNLTQAFESAEKFTGEDLWLWDTGNVVSFERMFKGNFKFNGNVSTFQLQKATHLGEMFRGCASFNGELGAWQVSKVSDTNSMFRDASKFVSVNHKIYPNFNPLSVTPNPCHSHTMLRPVFAPKAVANSRSCFSHVSSNRLGPGSRSGRQEV